MADTSFLSADEQVQVEFQFKTSGGLGFLVKLLGPLLKADTPDGAFVTNQRVVKLVNGKAPLGIPLNQIEKVYWNTSSNSFAVVAQGQKDGLLIPLVNNAGEVGNALTAMNVALEKESMSPRRRFLK